MIGVRSILALALLFPSGSLRAQEDASGPGSFSAPAPQQHLVDRGNLEFRQGRFQAALELYRKAFEESGHAGLHYPMARCREELGDLAGALQSFESFLAWPQCPEDARRKAARAVERIRKRLAQGTLLLAISPVGAEVRVNGRMVGRAPLAPLQVSAGRHEIHARCDGHVEARQWVEVAGAGQARVTMNLPPVPAPVETATRAEASRPASSRLWAWIGLGLSAAIGAGGGICLALAEADLATVRGAEGYGGGPIVRMTERQASELIERADDRRTLGWWLVGAGAAGAAASITLLLLFREPRDAGLSAGVDPQTGRAWVLWGGRF